MNKVFADSGFWIALLNPLDALHVKAVELTQSISPESIVTSEMVLSETLNNFSHRGRGLRSAGANAAAAFAKSGDVTVIPQTSGQFQDALQRYAKMADKAWSLTDCASFLIMEERGIKKALTYDRHFEQAGFEAMLR
jgi:predicted nucleic acid-binding protein